MQLQIKAKQNKYKIGHQLDGFFIKLKRYFNINIKNMETQTQKVYNFKQFRKGKKDEKSI